MLVELERREAGTFFPSPSSAHHSFRSSFIRQKKSLDLIIKWVSPFLVNNMFLSLLLPCSDEPSSTLYQTILFLFMLKHLLIQT
ncbi:hypothetical protein Ahy_A07g034651 isoform D [Arachis hypogaea]|uniref:Uncharacterized protein n=1 Tax=Arachis hypogaea TaxID=3818 RepID=A0A445CCD2_ARAHY|nr:hypothetical protein Ahy_A07g034651 isoform D [Arachis hypogaea]